MAQSEGNADARPMGADDLIDPRGVHRVRGEVAQRELAVIVACEQSPEQELAVARDAVGYAQHLTDVVANSEVFRRRRRHACGSDAESSSRTS